MTGVTVRYPGTTYSYEKISDLPPQAPEPVRPRVTIQLARDLLDTYVGQYEFAPNTIPQFPEGLWVTIWREEDQLISQARDRNHSYGIVELYPESETIFFSKINGVGLTFIKNDKGETTGVIVHSPRGEVGDYQGKKLPGPDTSLPQDPTRIG